MAQSSNNQSSGPWRVGRPSIKAYYPEMFLLGLVTIACIAIGFKLSCNDTKPSNNQPAEAQSDAMFELSFANYAYAQDEAIDKVNDEQLLANMRAEVVEEQVAAQEQAEAEAAAASQPVETSAQQPEPKKGANKTKTKLIVIWSICLLVPAVLWIWRGWIWLVNVYGVRYELRCDADNPKATTFLITRGILNKSTDSMHLGQIKDIRNAQSLVQKYLKGGVGDIILYTSDKTDACVEMRNMAEPSRVFNAFDELRRHYWSRGGMQLSSGGTESLNVEAGAENMDSDMHLAE